MKFLQLTAISDFTPQNQDIEYLGEWCKKNLNDKSKTFNYVWNSGKKVQEGALYSMSIYKVILPLLVDELNRIHKLEKSEQYWETIIGTWLIAFIQVVYERYVTILDYKKYSEFTTLLLSENSFTTPLSYGVFTQKISQDDKYNYQLYSQIISFLGNDFSSVEYNTADKYIFRHKSSLKKKAFSSIFNFFSKNKDITLSSPYFSNNRNLFRFLGKVNFNEFDDDFSFKFEKDLKKREILFEQKNDNEFINLLFYLFKHNFPILYLEGFKEFRGFVLSKKYPLSKVFVTATALHSNEIYKFFIAENRDKIKLILLQHGGGYGIYSISTLEFLERIIADKYLTWGWSEDSKTISNSHEKLNKKIFPKKKGYVLYVGKAPLKYIIRFSGTYNSSQNTTIYLPKVLSFLSNIKNIRQFMYRGYISDIGFNISKEIRNSFPELKFDDNSKKFHYRLKEAKLFVTDHVHTTYLETLAMNFPTVIFITKEVHSFREPKYFKLLENAKILFYNEIEAAKHVNKIAENPEVWWNSDEVQTARKKFVHQYARTSENWAEEWIKEFDKILDSEK
jgi:putative transferase (TIGR04331 family)